MYVSCFSQFITNKGEAWKEQRSSFSPVFTSGKLKAMSGLIRQTSDNLMTFLDEEERGGRAFDAKDVFDNYR